MNPPLLCVCNFVPEAEVRRAIRAGAHTLAAVQAACGAGTACSACQHHILRLLREETGEAPLR